MQVYHVFRNERPIPNIWYSSHFSKTLALWTYACTVLRLPLSVSHALVGGIIGTGLVKEGYGV